MRGVISGLSETETKRSYFIRGKLASRDKTTYEWWGFVNEERRAQAPVKPILVRGEYQLKIAPVSPSLHYMEETSVGMEKLGRKHFEKAVNVCKLVSAVIVLEKRQTQKILDNTKIMVTPI